MLPFYLIEAFYLLDYNLYDCIAQGSQGKYSTAQLHAAIDISLID
jgi:hypothetical protein